MPNIKQRRGFTLIELLVVIAIIALLAAILFPVFAKVREKARQTACLNNERQIAITLLAWAQDHDETFPPADVFFASANLPPNTFQCPSVTNLKNGYAFNAAVADEALGSVRESAPGNSGENALCDIGRSALENSGGRAPGHNVELVQANGEQSSIGEETEVFLLADGKGGGGPADAPGDLAPRHVGKVMAVFCDGHVTLCPPEKLFRKAVYVPYAIGRNNFGQLGNNSTTNSLTLVSITGLPEVTLVAAGRDYNLVMKPNGSVWGWGLNDSGQLGDGTTTNRLKPVQVSKLSGVMALAPGNTHSLALAADGTVWAWGKNDKGQLGDGTTTDRLTPVQVSGLSDVTGIAPGWNFSAALKSDGTVWTWGCNDHGQLGDNTTTDRLTPIQVPGLNGVKQMDAGFAFIAALKSDGTVWTWGWNICGDLGDGTVVDKHAPIVVPGLSGVKTIDIGPAAFHTIAVLEDGTARSWGANECGELGNKAPPSDSYVPVKVSGLTGISRIAVGLASDTAILSNGAIWAWGYDRYGQLGFGVAQTTRALPAPSPMTGATAFSMGYEHAMVLKLKK